MARVNTYERTGAVDAAAADLPQTPAFSAADVASGKTHITEPIEIERVRSMELAAAEAFMHEPVEIHLHDPSDESDQMFAQVSVNGNLRVAKRGEYTTWPRSHVAVLANARTERLAQREVALGDGSRGYEERMVSKLSYPFSVIHDPSGKRGADWLKHILSQRA